MSEKREIERVEIEVSGRSSIEIHRLVPGETFLFDGDLHLVVRSDGSYAGKDVIAVLLGSVENRVIDRPPAGTTDGESRLFQERRWSPKTFVRPVKAKIRFEL